MRRIVVCFASLLFATSSSLALSIGPVSSRPAFLIRSAVFGHERTPRSAVQLPLSADDAAVPDNAASEPIANNHRGVDRRSLLSSIGCLSFLISPTVAAVADGSKPKIVVMGGSGWVGAHVDELLLDKGCDVVSVSRSSANKQAEKIKANLSSGTSLPIKYVSLDASSSSDLVRTFEGAAAVISLVGAKPGDKNQRAGNGAVNIRIADAAKEAGVGRFVYISVGSDLASGPGKFLFGDYFKGKAEAEAAVDKDFGAAAALVLKPAIIAGAPPGDIRPPGPPGMKPVPVEAVAKVAVAGALGYLSGKIDGNDEIIAAAS